MSSAASARLVVPMTATYRVQLNQEFTLRDALAIVPYLQQLGISHLYCSPILKARKGSTHGYDVADPSIVNPEIGSVDDLRALASELHERGMGMLVDIVPNHMGIGPDNPYWEDVLTHGRQSRYAKWFDIDWDGGDHKVVLPVLGDEVDQVLEKGEFKLDVAEKIPRLRYFDNSWPVDPATLPADVDVAHFDPTAVAEPTDLLQGEEGKRRLGELLEAQHYRLTHWKSGPKEINYRRFFDVNELAALRQEDPEVFAETHAFVLSLVREGVIDALRIDHVDGLLDPLGYLERLRSEAGEIPIFVEKILTPGEHLRREWPVQGTTGYEFLNDLEDVFLDADGYDVLERSYRRVRRLTNGPFADVAHQGKVKILTGALQADVARLGRLLQPLAPDSAPGKLTDGIVQFIAALPVYRTYIDGRTAVPHADDVAVIDRAVREAGTRVSDADVTHVVQQIADVLLRPRREPEHSGTSSPTFVQRLQQTSGPATAKGVEDTALYVYVPLASRNEVGGAPDRPLDAAVERLHRANAERAEQWPSALLCTNTHDTKRSADVRARLDVLSECHEEWHRHFTLWRRLNNKHRSVVKGRLAPDTNTEYLLYQTLLGIWPSVRRDRRIDDLPESAWLASASERLEQYMLKAVREAKVRTSWTSPDSGFEDALKKFIAAIMDPGDGAPFLPDVARFASRVAPLGHWNALSRVLLHLASPGTPDTYRGDELWFFALVDPDNRQPVDYEERRKLLEEIDGIGSRAGAAESETFFQDPADPRLKLLVVKQLLNARRDHPDLFSRGIYRPLVTRAGGERADHVIAFARSHGDEHALAIASRLPAKLELTKRGSAAWGSTALDLPAELRGRRWRSAITGADVGDSDGGLELSRVLNPLPFVLLLSTESTAKP